MNQPNFADKDKLKKEIEVEKPVFDLQFQAGLLKLCLKDDYFCSQLVHYLNSDKDLNEYIVFDSTQFHYLFQVICKSLDEYKTRPDVPMLRQNIMEFAEDEREPYFKALDIIETCEVHNEEYYRKYITAFVQQVKMAKGFKKTRSIWKEDPMGAPDYMQKVIDGIRRVQFEQEDILHLRQVYSLSQKENDKFTKIPTGLSRLDEDMRGGFPRETLVTVLGASNAGKSIFCASLGCSAVRKGFKVLVINLEGTRDEVVYRYISNLTDIPFYKIEENLLTISEREKVDEVIQKYDSNLKFRNMLNFGVTVEDVITYCRETYKDFQFDMLIVDYGQLLKTKDKAEKFDRQTEVYRGLDSISKEFHCVVVSPAQSTRDGIKRQNEFNSKTRKKDDKLPVLRSDDLADCIEIARVSAVIITLNRTEEEEQRGWLRVFLEKQRRGKKAITYGVKAKYDRSNLITNDYYDPNSLVHKSEDNTEEENPNDNREVNLKKIVNEKSQIFKTEASIQALAKSENPDENEYNTLLLSYEKLNKEKNELNLKFDLSTDLTVIEDCKRQLKEMRKTIKDIKEKAKILLPKFMPNASEEYFKLISESIKDKNNNSSGTSVQDAKTELVYKQLALVYG